jgi:hypothetical protein
MLKAEENCFGERLPIFMPWELRYERRRVIVSAETHSWKGCISATFLKEDFMGKELKQKKNEKKKPTLSLKEKREAKKAKKESKSKDS